MTSLTKSEIINAIAETTGLTRRQVLAVLEAQAELAYRNANRGFQIPLLGKIIVRRSAAREMVMQFGPKKGQTVKVPAKARLRFVFAKPAKDAILRSAKDKGTDSTGPKKY